VSFLGCIMTETGIQEKVMEAVIIMNTAIINLRLYPPTNAMIVKTIERLYDTLQNILAENETISLAESERSLLIAGESLTQRNQQKPQSAIFLMLMITWGIKSISFHKGLDKGELSSFLEMLGKKRDDVVKEKGLEQIISEGNMPHIQINQKIYVEQEQDRQIVASLEIKDEEILKYITNENPDVTLDQEKLKKMAKDPELVARIFQSGIQHLAERDGTQSNKKLSESMLYMMRTLDKITDHEEKEKLSSLAAKSISDMDANLIAMMLTQNMEGLLDNHLFDQVIDRIDHEKFKDVAFKLRQAIGAPGKEGIDHGGEKIESAQQAYQHLMDTDRGIELDRRIREDLAREKEERELKIRETKEKINHILNRFEKGLPDESDVKALPELLDFLCSEEETGAAEATLERLTAMLQSDRPDIRAAASESLACIFDDLSTERRTETLTRYLERLTDWMKFETTATGAFRKICMHLKELAAGWIQNQRLADSLPILDTFSHIASDPLKKDDQKIQFVASEILGEIASPGILQILIEEFQTDKQNQRKEAGKHLLIVAEHSINPLLDLLLVSEVSSERVLVLNLIPEMGNAAAPAIIARIKENAPWHYLRNLARLLSRTGSEEDAKVSLAPLLLYGDLRVQKEAFRSINTIGGSSRGEIFLNALSGCDDQLKVNLVTSLGSLKHTAAVKPLIELFKSKTGLSEEMKVELQEKICVALGNMGNREALPFLKEVSTQSGIFGFKSYKPKVKAAAVRAVGMLSNP
jgi:HEAT repeat protein